CIGAVKLSPRMFEGTKNYGNVSNLFMVHGNNNVMCSAIAVSETAIITAASCFDSLNGDYSSVSVMSETSMDVVIAVIVHENYTNATGENNIALISVENVKYQPGINLTSENNKNYTNCKVGGFGNLNNTNDSDMVSYYENVTVNACNNTKSAHICAGAGNGEELHPILCYGDIGAPLICNGELVGIAVTQSNCDGTGATDEYQNIKDVKEWIENNIPDSAVSIMINPFTFILTMALIVKTKL
ncbi:hypothetical protein L9F63_020593, partial [Diploptera punctata]